MTVFRRHTKSQPRIKQLRKLHLSSLFDRLALGYWHENFADWYETKGKSIFFSHAGFESRVMRFSGPKSPWSRNRSKSNSPPLSFFLQYSNRQTQCSPNRLVTRHTEDKIHQVMQIYVYFVIFRDILNLSVILIHFLYRSHKHHVWAPCDETRMLLRSKIIFS